MKSLHSSVHPAHFEDFDGRQFERLVFAYLLRTDRWASIEWYGQGGSDSGRDTWGVRENDLYPKGEKVCVQCANRRRLPPSKIEKDIERVVSGPKGLPDCFLVVAGGSVSAKLRDDANRLAGSKNIRNCEIWSGSEFEERLRVNAESLLKRFVEGDPFPDALPELRKFVSSLQPAGDSEILALMASLFDRPAFYTPFHQESSIPAFKKAITDTIEALNTGVHRLRDGTEIRRIPTRHGLRSRKGQEGLRSIEMLLCELRSEYDEYIRRGDIRPCGCAQPDCPVFMVSPNAARVMDSLRTRVLEEFKRLYPPFNVRLGWHPSGP